MKTMKIVKHTLLAAFLMLSFAMNAQDQVITSDEVPTAIKTYLSNHFPDQKIMRAEIDMEGFSKRYEIRLQDGYKLEFDHKYRVLELDSRKGLPESVIPKRIRDYVKSNYPQQRVTDWEMDDGKQNVELDNGLELEFDRKGNFLRIDD